jgi:hypothetical protein
MIDEDKHDLKSHDIKLNRCYNIIILLTDHEK